MTETATATTEASRELSLTRLLDAPRAAIWRCWTESDLLMQWFCPKPWRVTQSVIDLRVGGTGITVMGGPNGEVSTAQGVYLDVVPQQRLVFSDAFTEAWLPSQKPFMVGIIEMADEAGKTRYTATVRHWSVEDREMHEKMGFHEGWGIATDQLEALAKTL